MLDKKGNVLETHDFSENVHRLTYEFQEFIRMVAESDQVYAAQLCETSLAAVRILEAMRPYVL